MHPVIPAILFGALVAFTREEPAPRPVERVVLLPDADGKVGALSVATRSGELLLDRAYAAAEVAADGMLARVEEAGESVAARFAAALEAEPPAPVAFTVYFVFDTDELAPESRAQFEGIKAELARRPAPEIVVVGHTDRVGSVAYNDALSLKRAERVRAALIEAGIDPAGIEIAGRGEREPVVPTADEAEEPRNRRVEIRVR